MKNLLNLLIILFLISCSKETTEIGDGRVETTARLTFNTQGSGSINQSSGSNFVVGNNIDVEATPNQGWQFSHFQINNAQFNQNPLQWRIEGNVTITAVFTNISIQASAEEGGSVQVTNGDFSQGNSATVEAIPDSNYLFVRWSNGSTDNPLTINIGNPENVTALFEFDQESYDAQLADILSNKIIIEGEGNYDFELTNENNGVYTFQITPLNSDSWKYYQYQTPDNIYSQNTFQLIVSDNSAPITLRFSNVFHVFEDFENVYAVASSEITQINEGAIDAIQQAINLLDGYGQDLSNLKFVLFRLDNASFAARALGVDTIIYRYNVNENYYQQFNNWYWENSVDTWIHECFHIIDGRLGGRSFTQDWQDQLEAAKLRQNQGTYSITQNNCGIINNDDYHYELTNNFEFFAVTMTARVNICSNDPNNTTFNASTVLGNSDELNRLLPEVYSLADLVLNGN